MKTTLELPEPLLTMAEQLSGLSTEAVIVEALQSYIRQFDETKSLRQFGEQFSSFEFWESSEEDVYHDLIHKKP
jgi:hypothetical protein